MYVTFRREEKKLFIRLVSLSYSSILSRLFETGYICKQEVGHLSIFNFETTKKSLETEKNLIDQCFAQI